MFNESWLALAIFISFLGVLFRVEGLLPVAALIFTVAGVAWAWNRFVLYGVEYERAFSERRAFLGETVDVAVRVTNRKLLPLGWLQIEDEWPMAVSLLQGELTPTHKQSVGFLGNLFSLRWYERVERRYQLRCEQRGFYPFGPARLTSGDVFGLFSQQGRQEDVDWLVVYPRVWPVAELGLPPKEPFGATRARQRIFEDPSRAVGIRDHQPEDSFRHIHWKATARRQALQVKVYEPTTTFSLVVVLNVTTFPKHWHGVDPELLERAISVAASIVAHGVERHYTVGVVANGCLPGSDQPIRVLPGRGPDQLTRVLEMLAAVRSFPISSIEDLLLSESPRLPWGATLVVVTATVPEELQATIMRLKEAGRRLVLISLARRPLDRELPGILTYHLPPEPKVSPESGASRSATAPGLDFSRWKAKPSPAGGGQPR